MKRLTAPNGAVVRVADEKAARLVAQGYKRTPEPTKPASPARAPHKTATTKPNDD